MKVAVLGGGVAGLSAAHELSKRGFSVSVFEASSVLGGKARSFYSAGWSRWREVVQSEPDDIELRKLLGWAEQKKPGYLKRYRDASRWLETYADKLWSAASKQSPAPDSAADLWRAYRWDAYYSRAPRKLPAEHGFHYFPAFYRHLIDTMADIPIGNDAFRRKSVASSLVAGTSVLVAREQPATELTFLRRLRRVEDVVNLSKTFAELGLQPLEVALALRKFAELWAASEQELETRYEKITWWNFLEADGKSDAYQTYLANIGVRSTVAMDPRVASARTIGRIVRRLWTDLVQTSLDNGVSSTDRFLNGPTNEVWIDPWVTYLHEADPSVTIATNKRVTSIDCEAGRLEAVRFSDGGEISFSQDLRALLEESQFHFCVCALPLKQLTDILKNSAGLRQADPQLRGLDALLPNNAWMTGLQLYLSKDIPISAGGIFLKDSPWAITAVSQSQFWRDELKEFRHEGHTIKTVLSVIISNWNAPGDYQGIAARACNPEQLRFEVWSELKSHLNDNPPFPNAKATIVLSDDDLVDYHVNNWDEAEQRWINDEQLFINASNSLHLRPRAVTQVKRFYMAGDFVRTNTDLATMEAANEAARAAVNQILSDAGSSEAPCEIWSFEDSSRENLAAIVGAATRLSAAAGTSLVRAGSSFLRGVATSWLKRGPT